jgi:DNA-binding transcriptional regulator YiaG
MDRVALPFYKVTLRAKKRPSEAFPKELKTIGDHIRKRRLELNLTQKEVATILKVSECSIWNWENNRNRTRIKSLLKISEFLVYIPN